VAHHAACGELGGGGGLADPGGADQRKDAAALEQVVVRTAGVHHAVERRTHRLARLDAVSILGHARHELARNRRRKAGLEQFAEHRCACRRLTTGLAPREAGELTLDHAADASEFRHQAGVGFLQFTHARAAELVGSRGPAHGTTGKHRSGIAACARRSVGGRAQAAIAVTHRVVGGFDPWGVEGTHHRCRLGGRPWCSAAGIARGARRQGGQADLEIRLVVETRRRGRQRGRLCGCSHARLATGTGRDRGAVGRLQRTDRLARQGEDLHATFDGAIGQHDGVRAEGFLERTERLAGGGGKIAFDVHGGSPGGRCRPLLDEDYRHRGSIARGRIKPVSRAYSADDAAAEFAATAPLHRPFAAAAAPTGRGG